MIYDGYIYNMKIAALYILTVFQFVIHAQTWEVTDIPSNSGGQRYDDVFFLNENEGWAANGYYASVYKTIDGGLNWVEVLNESQLEGDHYFRNIVFIDSETGFLGTLNGKFYKSNDGGSSWVLVNISPNPPAICGLDVVGNDTIYGCGAYFNPAYIIKSVDRGDTWTSKDMSTMADALVEIKFIDELTGFVAGACASGGCILKTTDGGESWSEIYNSGIAGQYVWKLQVFESDSNLIFGSVESFSSIPGKLLKSNDQGESWISYDAPEVGIQAVGFITPNRGWMGGHNTGIHETQDGGQTWTDLGIGSNLNRIFFVNETTLFASGTSIYKFSDQSLGLNDLENENSNQLAVKLRPNPVEDQLQIEIDFPSTDNLLLQLYSIEGKLIKQIIRDQIPASSTKTYIEDVSYLQNGMYFLNIHNNNNRFSIPFIKR